ncbi:MSFD8 [Lepeophtheirus salmonis]|uniref:MSFD8 n=1 Tax=Lepeophtheirus salmonis TaxID=72036 RepID=A0A817F8P2_LEPSM|nr:MSFD8 [Lepeophtheirus salmonis]CAG9474886.1 MSFD8 [Lepeophtheirus salmonis]
MNENPEQRKRRLRSIYVVHTSMFVFSLGFSINLTGVFPYMKQLLTNNSSEDILNRYGWVVAMNPLGQMIASPLLGYIFNKTNDLRSISMAMAVVYILGNSLYSILSLFPEGESSCWMVECFYGFQERSLHNRNKTEADTKSISLEKPDYLAALISLLNFFVFQAVFVLLETLGTPLCMDNFAWSEETTVFYLGIIMSSGGVMSFICFLTIPPLSKKFDERYFYLLPLLTSMKAISTGTGCDYDWCNYVPVLQLWQMLVSYAVGSTSIPFCVTICSIIFTKLLGPRPQGVWMGALASSGSFARVIGPIIVSYIYRIYDDIEITKL